MFALDTNLLVYTHNTASKFNPAAVAFLEKVLNERDEQGDLSVCLPAQVVQEFVHVVTWQRLEKALSLPEAIQIVEDYLDTGIRIVYPKETQLATFLSLLKVTTTRQKVFDVALAATLKDNEVGGLYTVNVADFETFDFLEVINPLPPE